MAEARPDQEPSMEEILASIRRIISDDNAPEGEEADAAPEEPAEAEAVVEDEPAEEEAVVKEIPEEDVPEEETEDEVYDLTEVVEEADVDDEAIEAPETDSVGEAVVMAQAAEAAAQSELMSDDTASMATNQPGGLVAAVAASESGTPLGRANLTIEDLVKDVMRPMIREWLDGNLPGLVERAVRREVERLSRRAENE